MYQEKIIFFPKKLKQDFVFTFSDKYDEIYFKTSDSTTLHGLLFKSADPKGLIFYLHGNAGALDTWGAVAKTYVNLNYDVFILDYRGFGKSEGDIQCQDQLFNDIQTAYNLMSEMYPEQEIVVLGYSIGTGPAAKLASDNNPGLLILQAPYYNLSDVMKKTFPIIPTFLLRYKLETDQYITSCNIPVVIFHGDSDEVIYYGSSIKLKELTKEGDTLITLIDQPHNGMTNNPQYMDAIKKILQ